MRIWRPYADEFLAEILRHERLPEIALQGCQTCALLSSSATDPENREDEDFSTKTLLQCTDCTGTLVECKSCCLRRHSSTPLHVVKVSFFFSCLSVMLLKLYRNGTDPSGLLGLSET